MTSPFSEIYTQPSDGATPTDSPFAEIYGGKPQGEGVVSRAVEGVKGTVEALGEIAKGIPKFFLYDLPRATGFASGGLTKEQLANPIIRARLITLGQNPDQIKPVSNEQAIMGAGPIPFAKSVVTGPIEEAKAAGLAETPRERAKHAAAAAFLALAPLQPFMKGAAKPSVAATPGETPIGSPQPTPVGPEASTAVKLGQDVIEQMTKTKKPTSEATKSGRDAYNSWRTSTPEQRAARFPSVADVIDKSWKELTKEQKRAVRAVTDAESAIKALDELSKANPSKSPVPPPVEPYQPKVDLPGDKSTFTPLEAELDRVHGNIIGLEAQHRTMGTLIDNSRHRQFLLRYAQDLENEIRTERANGETAQNQPQPDVTQPGRDVVNARQAASKDPEVQAFLAKQREAASKPIEPQPVIKPPDTNLGQPEPGSPRAQANAAAALIEGKGAKVAQVINKPRNAKAQAALEAKRAARAEPTPVPSTEPAPSTAPSPSISREAPPSPTTTPAPAPGAAGTPPSPASDLKLIDSQGPLFGKSLDELDALIDKLDEVSTGQNVKLIAEDLARIAAAKKVLKARNTVGAQAPNGQVYPEFDMPTDVLRSMQETAKRMGGVEGNDMRAAANRGLRFNKTFEELGDRLDLHIDELKSAVKNAKGPEQERIQRRLADAIAAQARKAAGDITQHVNTTENSILRNEKGAIKLLPDPLEAYPDLSAYSESGKRILSQIDVEGTKTSLPSWPQFVNAMRFHIERKILPIEEAVRIMSSGKYLPKFLDAGAWAQLYSGHPVRSEFMLTDSPFRWTPEGNIIISPVRGYARIVSDVRGKIPELRIYETAARTIDAAEQGKKTGINLADAVKEFTNAKPEIVAAAQESVAFRNEILKYWADGGGLSPDAVRLMVEAWPHYAPFQRVLEGKSIGGLGRTLSSKGNRLISRTGVEQPVKRFVGSEGKIQDVIQSTVDMTRRLVRASDRNRIFRNLVELAENNPELAKGIVEKVDKKRIPASQLEAKQADIIKETKRLFDEKGIKYTDASVSELVSNLTERELGRGSDQIRFWRDGKAETWRVHPDIARAIESLDPQKVQWWVQLMSLPTQSVRAGIVYNPMFFALNAFKDSFEATIRSRYGFMPWHSIRGFGDAMSGTGVAKILGVTPTEYQRGFKATGGAFSSVSGIRAQTTAAAVRAVLPGRSPVLTSLTHPIELLKKMSEPFEEAARIGEFRNALGKGKTAFDAALAAKTNTVDFNMSGASMQGLNMITAFLNPAIQSFSADMRALGQNPRRVMAIGSGIALGTAMLWAANRDDEEINQLRKTPYGKLWWWFRGPDGGIYKAPKPYFWGQVFASGAEAALDALEAKDPNAARDWINAVKQQVEFTVIPNAVQYGLAVKGNRDPLTNATIVPERMEDIDPMFQIRPTTSFLARKSGEWFDILNVSPIQVDYFIKSTMGTLGVELNKAATIAMENDARVPEPLTSELPFINRIMGQYPSLNVEPLIRFRDRAADMEVINNTVMYLAKEEPEKLEPYVKARLVDVALSKVYAGARQSMNEIYAAMSAIDKIPASQMAPQDRRARKEALVRSIIKIADVINQRDEAAQRGELFTPDVNQTLNPVAVP